MDIKVSVDKNKTPFDPRFKPSYTPIEMLKMGIFGGSYWSDSKLKKSTPSVIFMSDKTLWGNKEPNREVNYYKVLAGMNLDFWTNKKLIHNDDPAGWFQWYCNYYYGRRHEDDKRQIGRWRSFVARHGAQAYEKPGRERQKQALLQWAWNVNINPQTMHD